MTLAERIYDALAAARQTGPLDKPRWLSVVSAAEHEHKVANKRKPNRTKLDRPRNPLFDALATATGCQDISQLTRNGAKAVGVALADIKEVCPSLTVEQINRVVDAYRRKHPTWPCTAPAIAKNWAEFAKTTGGAQTATAKTDVYQEPPNWQQSEPARLAINASPETWQLVIERGWFALATDIRAGIHRGLASA